LGRLKVLGELESWYYSQNDEENYIWFTTSPGIEGEG
jgi:hypothetical protein